MPSSSVSVVIPCFNQGHFLEEALASVRGQSRPAAEVIVVDDGSTDATAAVASRFPGVHCVRQPNRGLSSARNRGLAASTGDFVVFLDADDRLRPGALATGVEQLQANADCALVFGRCQRVDERGRPLPTVPPPPLSGDAYRALLQRNYIWTPAAAMFRRALCGPLLHFRSGVDAAADYEVYLRIARRLPIRGHEHVVVDYRVHGGSMSRNAALMLTSTLAVLKAQRELVRGDPDARRAFRRGVRAWREYYGEQLVEEIRRHARSPREWGLIVTRGSVLLRHYPEGAATHLRKKLRLTVGRASMAPRSSAADSARREKRGRGEGLVG